MSRVATTTFLLMVAAAQLRAQGGRVALTHLARAEQLQDSLKRVDDAAAHGERDRALVGNSGPIRVLIRAGQGSAQSVADAVWAIWRENGFPDSILGRFVLAEDGIASRGEMLGNRRAVIFGRPGGLSGSDRRFAAYMADNAAWSLSEALLDTTMGAWLERRFDPRLAPRSRNLLATEDLKLGEWQSTRGCLSGSAADCVVYLGLELRPDFRIRYPIADIRRHYARSTVNRNGPVQSCLNGDDSTCAALWAPVVTAPASLNARTSLLDYVRERYGPIALARLVLDTSSTVSARFRSATGLAPVELAESWRNWLLPPTARWPLAAGGLQASVSAIAVLILLAMASRSGRWRA